MALERGLALQKPAGESKKEGRMVTGKGERRVHERIGLYKCAVEVDTERWKSAHAGF